MNKDIVMFVIIILHAIFIFSYPGNSKELPLLVDKQGTFEFLRRSDYAWYQCGFSGAEVNDNLKELGVLVNTIRANPVLNGMKGFDCRVELYTITDCKGEGGYGIPVEVSFGFCSWFMLDNGKPAMNPIEPPSWKVIVNKMRPSSAGPVGSDAYFGVPNKKETIRPGIDIYDGELYIIYNPDRPHYWIPVTVREAYNKLVERTKKDQTPPGRDMMLKMIEKQYAAFSEADRNKPAYTAGQVGSLPRIMGEISTDITGSPMVRVNHEYWNRNLPRSAIQFMFCTIINNKAYIIKLKEEYLKGNSTSYNLYRFLETLDYNTAISLLRHIRK
jgi:hypothetical protein